MDPAKHYILLPVTWTCLCVPQTAEMFVKFKNNLVNFPLTDPEGALCGTKA